MSLDRGLFVFVAIVLVTSSLLRRDYSGDSEGAENTEWKRRQRGRGEYGDVDIQVGSGFLNYINGYVAQSSDCVDFSAKEYSEADGEGAENTDWKRTYRGLMKGTPARNAAARLQGSRLMNA